MLCQIIDVCMLLWIWIFQNVGISWMGDWFDKIILYLFNLNLLYNFLIFFFISRENEFVDIPIFKKRF